MRRSTTLITCMAIGAVALSGCGSDNNSSAKTAATTAASVGCADGALRGAGSTFQKNIVSQWIKDYTAACSKASVDYQGVGSGAGITQFGAGTIDFAGSDSTMKPAEQQAADKRCGSPALHLPITAGGVAIAYHLQGVTSLQLSPATLAGIFQGTISHWNDAAIKADNPSLTLPATPITAVHREDASGTTDIISHFLATTAGPAWKLGTGKDLNWPAAVQGAKGSDGVTQAVGAVDGGITYAEVSYVGSNGVAAAKVRNGAGQYLGPDSAAVATALGGATLAAGNDLKVQYDYANTTRGAYPITAVSYEIVCSHLADPAKQKLLKAFLTYAVTTGQDSAQAIGYAPLPAALVTRITSTIATLT